MIIIFPEYNNLAILPSYNKWSSQLISSDLAWMT